MSEDSKRPIPKEELSAYERWELPAMESGHVVMSGGRRSGRDEEREPKPLTAEEIEAIRQAAWDEGRAEGMSAGREEGLAAASAEIRQQLEHLRKVADSLLAPIETEKDQLEETLVALLLQIARQVVARELRLDSSQVRELVDEAIAALPAGADRIRIAVSAADLALLQEHEPAMEQECSFRADPTLQAGGCRVETEYSLVDYSVDARFRSAVAAMVGRRYEQLEAMLQSDLAESAATGGVGATEVAQPDERQAEDGSAASSTNGTTDEDQA